jgi:WD40 repeat protein/DNA-binding SARP family transcriptional activator
MRFQVLGPLEVEADNGPVALGGPKERLLLALLLARPNQVVSVEALVRGLWGERPPATAAKTLQSHVKRLRRALEPERARGAAGQVLMTREPGYLLRVAPGALDAARFEELTAKAGRALADGSAQAAGSMLREALGLWRGQAFEEFLDSDVVLAEADRLAELRLVALEDRLEADLRLGRHRELVAELEGLVREQPLRERLWAQLLLALYRSGRQADALLAFQRARSVLVEELGIDPGSELRRLHAAVLAQDPALDSPPTAELGPARELPPALGFVGPAFVGRAAEVAWLRAAWTRATIGRGGMALVAGRQGMGKTRLAAEFAREVHDQGGWVLYGRCIPEPNDPLQPFVQALTGVGVSLQDVPVSSPGRFPAALSQGLADLLAGRADRAVLLVLDDLHLAPAPVLEGLAGLAAAAAAQRLLVLGTYRDEAATPELAALVQRLDPGGAGRRRLGPLNQDEVAKVLGLYGSEQAARAAADTVLARTGGVPVLVHQVASDWAQAQAAQQIAQVAGQTATSRSHLRVVQSQLADEVVDLRELHEHGQQVARLAGGQGAPSEEQADDRPAAAVCPYKGLARFEASDAEFFFGRERLVAELVTHLVGAGLVGVVGPSGSGKSSLVRAGLLPALAEGVLPGSARWRQLVIRPGEHPMAELAQVGGRPGVPADGSATTATDHGNTGDGPVPGRSGGESALRAVAAGEHLLLVVDQFEEVFTTCRDEGERAAFLATLTGAAQAADGYATVVVAVRADYYGHCAAEPTLAGLLAANHVLVGPMDTGELRRAIELPARRAQLRLEPGLADAMIGEVAEEPGGLPLLSCALLESWQRRRGRTLTLAAYQQAGGVHGAVARLAERAWQQLDPDDQAVASRILLRLAGPGEGEAVVRRRVPLDELTTAGGERGQVVLDALADQRLLAKGADSVEVAHEALLREWPRLRGWLEDDVQGRALHRHLIGAAQEWEQSGRDPGELYRGARLTGALDWARDHDADLNQLEREFLDASRAAAEREVAEARRRAEREARTSRRLRGLVAGLAVVLALALVAGGLALSLRGRAQRQALVADAGRLGALALTEDQLDRSLLLASQAVALDDSLETRGDLLAALLRSPAATAILRGHLDGINPIDLSPDGHLLAMGDGGGRVEVFDLRTRRPLPGNIPRAGTPINDLAFSPDGSLLAAANSDGLVQLWDVRTTTLRHQLRTALYAGVVQFSADGQTLVTFSADEADTPSGFGHSFLTRWDVKSGRPLTGPVRVSSFGGETLLTTSDGVRLVTLSDAEVVVTAAETLHPVRRVPRTPRLGLAALRPNGRTLALGLDGGAVELLDLSTGRRRTLGRQATSVVAVEFSPDGATLATGGVDGKVMVWDVDSGQVRETFEGHEGRIGMRGLRFSRDGHTLYSAGPKSVIAWDLAGSDRLGRRFSFPTTPTPPAFAISPDGSVLATPDGKRSDHIALRDLRSLKQTRQPLAPGIGRISAIAFGPDGKRLAVGGERADSAPVLVDVASGKVTRRMTGGHDGGFISMAFDPNGQRLLAGGHDRRAIVWEVETGRQLLDLHHPGDDPFWTAAAWSPDGTMVATAGGAGQVVLWRASDGKQLATFQADPLWVPSVAFSPDGSLLAAGGYIDKQATLWEVATHKLVGRLPHPTILGGLAFDPSGKTLATAAGDGTVRLWDVASRRQIGLALPGGDGDGYGTVGFDPSGNQLVILYQDGTGVVWDVDPDHWKQRACSVAGRSLTREEWEELLPEQSYQPACR